MTHRTTPDPAPVQSNRAPDSHHGDLRKAAYLKRRAAYQMQADKPATAQAGTLNTDTSTSKQAGRLR